MRAAEKKQIVQTSLWELGLYAVLVAVYFLCVLHYFGGFLQDLFLHQRTWYAFVALALMIGQAAGLEWVASALVRMLGRRKG